MSKLVTQETTKAWGAAVFAGTRVPVDTLFDYIERGYTLDYFLDEFPSISRERAIAVLEEAKKRTMEEATRL